MLDVNILTSTVDTVVAFELLWPVSITYFGGLELSGLLMRNARVGCAVGTTPGLQMTGAVFWSG